MGLLIACLSLSCGISEPDQQNDCTQPEGYPSKRCLMPPGELETLQQAYTALNDGQLYATQLDSFGYITREGMIWRGLAEDICPSEEALMIARAKAAVLKFSPFTYVTDTTLLAVAFSEGFSSDSGQCKGQEALIYRGWSIHFHNQVYEQIEVLGTQIEVGLNSDKVYWIEGHWYPEIIVPDCELMSFKEAKELVVGTDITYYGFAGEPHVFTVGEDSFMGVEEKVVLPIQVSNYTELRVAWRLGIEFLSGDRPSWYIYVDTITGETIAIHQLFKT